MSKPFLLGLTGSIGMGKSTTAKMFAEAGVPVWDADAAVHRLYSRGGAAVVAMRSLHPDAVVDGAVDRVALKDWISAEPGALARIESVVHPLVAQDRADFIEKNQDVPVIVLDIPLLFETGGSARVDAIVVVTAPPDVQRARVLERGTMSEEQFEIIVSKQVPDAQKRTNADYVIETTSLEAARAAVQDILSDISKRRTNA